MKSESRIYGTQTKINTENVHAFYESRFSTENPLASVMMRANPDDGIAELRNQNEMQVLSSLLDLSQSYRIFDIGCGLGRWAGNLADSIALYDGIDFTQNYVTEARKLFPGAENVRFTQMSATDIQVDQLHPPYDLVIINGLCVYLNDEDLQPLFEAVASMVSPNPQIYFRESISIMESRLTLKDFPSEELAVDYNAVYRTAQEYETFFQKHLPDFQIQQTDLLLTKELGAREETNQRFWLLKSK